MEHRFAWKSNGKALSENTIQGARFRITVLTPSLLRLEFDEAGIFEDCATQRVLNRDFPAVDFTIKQEDTHLSIHTSSLKLYYHCGQPFQPNTLKIVLKEYPFTTWVYDEDAPQLKGTARTLDGASGAIPLQNGILSRNGYTVMDDSDSALLSEDGWFSIRQGSHTDLYFFGYGHRYEDCLHDFFRLTGVPPFLPDYALGNWWSRYHAYTQEEYTKLIERFEKEDIPFSVAVVDMDWHITKNVPKECVLDGDWYAPGWTGWTWDEELFPDYKAFLSFLKQHHLKTSLNLHPAQGIGCHEVMYRDMANACGIDPESKAPVKMDILNPDFMAKFFDIVLHPYEAQGVDFWWMDWQQGTDYWWIHDAQHPRNDLEIIDPLWLLNHLFILDIERNGKRPMFFSRYAGLGSHRYPIGFSGDSYMTWESLDFQPYFTANASNAGYGWWSHDIGGHHHGYKDDDMMIRWMQLGVFSPINRLHSTSNLFNSKEPWNLQPHLAAIATRYLQLRHRLFPYLYTMNQHCHENLTTLVRPLYYQYPENECAYQYKNEYFFGTMLLCAPITEKMDPISLHSHTRLYLPEGTWTDVFTGHVYEGDRELDIYRPMTQTPVFAKAGAIVPLQAYDHTNQLGNSRAMDIYVFPGADGSFTLYEDEGDGANYKTGLFAKTTFSFTYGATSSFMIQPPIGDTSFLSQARTWTVTFRGFTSLDHTNVSCSAPSYIVSYEEKTHDLVVTVQDLPLTQALNISIISDTLPIYENDDRFDIIFDVLLHAQMPSDLKENVWNFLQHNPNKMPELVLQDSAYRSLTGVIREMQQLHPSSATQVTF